MKPKTELDELAEYLNRKTNHKVKEAWKNLIPSLLVLRNYLKILPNEEAKKESQQLALFLLSIPVRDMDSLFGQLEEVRQICQELDYFRKNM